ncbi:ABC transporter permease [Bacillus manliponensis]|uniref:ABC transporter permease n=1 Tax=Bacillus manliponensis TaxID=574376 RepID=UPI003519106A
MNVYRLALQNVKGNWRSYKVFFFSSCFSIFSFFMYTSVIFHPIMSETPLYIGIKAGIVFCTVIVLSFSIIFILYSSSIFIQSRKKEFGLLILTGATKRNMISMLMIEQLVMGMAASAVGIMIGTLFLKLFFMIFSLLLHMPNEMVFIFSMKAVVLTVFVYGVLFSLLSVVNAFRIWKIEIIHLLKEMQAEKREVNRKQKNQNWRAVFGVVCILTAYTLALYVIPKTIVYIVLFFFPVVGLTTFGTYFVCTHGLMFVLEWMKKQQLMYKYPYLFIVNQLLHRVKDNRRFLFMLTMTTTFVITATGTVYLHFFSVKEFVEQPHAFSYEEKGVGSNEIIEKETIENLFYKHGVEEFRYITFSGVPAKMKLDWIEHVMLISEDAYNREAKRKGQRQFHLKQGKVAYVHVNGGDVPRYDKRYITVEIQGESRRFGYNGAYYESIFNRHIDGYSGKFLIMDDKDFQHIFKKTSDEEKYTYHGYELDQLEDLKELGWELSNLISDDKVGLTYNSILNYTMARDGGMLILFVGSFISILFFLASCSIVYFKWFYNLEYDRKQYQTLTKIGVTNGEVRNILRLQLAIPFFLPVLFGCIHSIVALQTYNSVFVRTGVFPTIVVAVGYICACTVFFYFAQREYMKHIG